MSKPISFEEFVSKKRQRPQENCFKCGKLKDIYTHFSGDKDKPLCNACNMKLRRESPSAAQVKLLKLSGTAIGAMEAMLGLPVEEKQKKTLQDMQDELKLMVRVWLGDTQADEEADDATEEAAGAPTSSATDEFTEARKAAAGGQADNLFEAPQSAPPSRKNRKALIAAKVQERKAARGEKDDAIDAVAAPNDQLSDPAYQEYLEAPLV